jgi:hypothetical protein
MKKKWCEKCKERKFCSVPCEGLNAYLRSMGIFSDDYIRPMVSRIKRKDGFSKYREIPFSSLGDTAKRKIGESDTNDKEDY